MSRFGMSIKLSESTRNVAKSRSSKPGILMRHISRLSAASYSLASITSTKRAKCIEMSKPQIFFCLSQGK